VRKFIIAIQYKTSEARLMHFEKARLMQKCRGEVEPPPKMSKNFNNGGSAP